MKSNKYLVNFIITVIMESNNSMFINQYNCEFCPKVDFFIKSFYLNSISIARNTSLKGLIRPDKLEEAVEYLKENICLYLIDKVNLERKESSSMYIYDITKNYNDTNFSGDYVGSGVNRMSIRVGFKNNKKISARGSIEVSTLNHQWSRCSYEIGSLGYQQYPACCHALIYHSFHTTFPNKYSRSILNLNKLPVVSDNIFNIFNTALTTGFGLNPDSISETDERYEMVYLISDSRYATKFVNRFFTGSVINSAEVINPRTSNLLTHTHVTLSENANFRLEDISFPEYKIDNKVTFKVHSFKYSW